MVTGAFQALPQCDLALIAPFWLGEVDYQSELSGKSEKFEEAARLSLSAGCGVVCGCTTLSRGAVRRSAAVADRGKLLGISDMLHVLDDEEYKSGAYLGIYSVGGYKVGVCIENDLCFPEGIRALSACGCNAIAVLCEKTCSVIQPLLARAYAFLYGVPIVMCAGKLAYFAETSGEVACSNRPLSLFETDGRNGYRLVATRWRGLTREEREDY